MMQFSPNLQFFFWMSSLTQRFNKFFFTGLLMTVDQSQKCVKNYDCNAMVILLWPLSVIFCNKDLDLILK